MEEIEQKKVKITLPLVIRWVLGSLFSIVGFGWLIYGNILAGVSLLFASFLLFPLFSEFIEDKMNIVMSGAVRSVLVIFLLVIFVYAVPTASNSVSSNSENTNNVNAKFANAIDDNNYNTQSSSTSSETTTTSTQDNSKNVCYWDWKSTTATTIGSYNKVPSGYEYFIVTVYLKNDADQSISTNPFSWDLIIDGIKYDPDSATYDSSIDSQSVEVVKGGERETTIVYLVKGKPESAELKYNGAFAPTMERISHY